MQTPKPLDQFEIQIKLGPVWINQHFANSRAEAEDLLRKERVAHPKREFRSVPADRARSSSFHMARHGDDSTTT